MLLKEIDIMSQEKIIPIIVGRSELVRFSMDADESFARDLIEQIDMAESSDALLFVSFSGSGWRIDLTMDTKVSMEVRDSVEEKLISKISLPEMLREAEDARRSAVATKKNLLPVWRRKINGFVDFMVWLWNPNSPHGRNKK